MKQLNAFILIGLVLLAIPAMFIIFSTPPAPDNAPWEDQGPEWYYYNINATDRQKIRQAMDHCVPRDEIINGLHLGFAEAIASPIGVNFIGVYEPTITARQYNLTLALDLFSEVTGYKYDENVDGTNETSKVTNTPYFKMTLVVPTTNTARSQWAGMIANSLNKIGIDAKLVWWNWDIIMPRIFLDPVGTGYDYEHGGYDMFFVMYNTQPDPMYKKWYDKDCFPPSNNYYWIEDGPATSGIWATTGPENNGAYPNITALWTDIYQEMDYTTRVELLKEYQQWYYDQVPTCIIRQEIKLWGLDANLQGFDTFHGIRQQICNWTGIGTNCVIVQPGFYADFNPLLSSNSHFDTTVFDNTHVSLSRRRGEHNFSHAYPWLAENWTHSADYKTWTVNIRQGNKWSDGENITADDVVFTYHTALNGTLRSPRRNILYNILGNDTDSNGKFTCVTKGINDYQVIFTLPEVFAYVETLLFDIHILPEHQMSQIDLTSWKLDSTNNGNTLIVANGPYMMHNFDNFDTVELWVNPFYNETAMGHNPSAIGGGNWLPDPRTTGHITNVTIKIVRSRTLAVSGLFSGVYDIIDPHMDIQEDYDKFDFSPNAKSLFSFEWGYQEMSINHYSPIWGMNPHYSGPLPNTSTTTSSSSTSTTTSSSSTSTTTSSSSTSTTTSSSSTSTSTDMSSLNITPLEASFVILGLLGLTGINILIKRKEE